MKSECHCRMVIAIGAHIEHQNMTVHETTYSTGQKRVPNRSGIVPTPYLKRIPRANRDRTMSDPLREHTASKTRAK